MGSVAFYIVCRRYVVCYVLTHVLATNIGAIDIIYSILLCDVVTTTLYFEHCYFIYCMMCTATCFVP